jgi:hypothetical protein
MEILLGDIEFLLRFNENIINRFILRKYIKAKSVTDKSIFKTAFLNIYQNIMKNARYLDSDSIYNIRRGLDKFVDGKIFPYLKNVFSN